MARLVHRAKRLLYLIHRWVGIVTCLLVAIWFVSGLVMIYVPYPSLERAERLAGLEPIAWDRVRISRPQPFLAAAGIFDPPRTLALEMQMGRPVWRAQPWSGEEIAISAETGRLLSPVSREEAARIAARFAHADVVEVVQIERDQWTVAGGYDADRPLWKVALAGAGGRVLYVSSRRGAVVLDTDARERFWNWLGSVPHWLYLTALRKDAELWRQVVLWSSGLCILGAVAGFWIGLLRVRLGRRRFRRGRRTPYAGWMRWHHVGGLVGGVFVLTFLFSGWLSVDPGGVFERTRLDDQARWNYANPGELPPLDTSRLSWLAAGAKLAEVSWIAGRPIATVDGAAGRESYDVATLVPAWTDAATLNRAIAGLMPDARPAGAELLTAPDAYWYEAGALPDLPMLRVRFDDPAETWVHIDPRSGRIAGVIDGRGRLYRWLFALLHKWDLNLLTLNRPAWDAVLWLLSLVGLVVAVTGVRIGWVRLRRSGRRPA
jgi:uncharacterized iron-regulated membrane protein